MSEQPVVRARKNVMGSDYVNGRKCALCGRIYADCRCVCKRCGAKIWTREKDEWKHHVCRAWGRLAAPPTKEVGWKGL